MRVKLIVEMEVSIEDLDIVKNQSANYLSRMLDNANFVTIGGNELISISIEKIIQDEPANTTINS